MRNKACFLLVLIWVQSSFAQFPNVPVLTSSQNQDPVQSQPYIAFSPSYENVLCAVWNHVESSFQVGWSLSQDKGLTWNDGGYFNNCFMPSVAFGHSSEPYVNLHCVYSSVSGGQFGGIYHTVTEDLSWGTPQLISYSNSRQIDPKIVIDNNSTSAYFGRAYVAWNGYDAQNRGQIFFKYLAPSHGSWDLGPEVEVDASTVENMVVTDSSTFVTVDPDIFHGPMYPDVAVAPNGDIYVAWMNYDFGYIAIRRSTDGGETFEKAVNIVEGIDTRGVNNVSVAWATIRPSITVSPNGHLFMVTSDRRSEPDADPVLRFFRSDDDGDNWSETAMTDEGEGHQYFFPTVVVTPQNGEVFITFMHGYTETYRGDHVSSHFAQSDDDGVSFGQYRQVSAEFSVIPETYEYIFYFHAGATTSYSENEVYPIWTDHRGSDMYEAPYVASLLTTTMLVGNSWNMVGLPHFMDNYSKDTVFPEVSNNSFIQFYDWSNGYQNAPDPLEPDAYTGEGNLGYWVKFPSSGSHSFFGTWKDAMQMTVYDGWNIIGSISGPVGTGYVQPSSGVSVISSYFGFDGSYSTATTLEPGKGYWVKVTGNGTLTPQYQYWGTLFRGNENSGEPPDEFSAVDSLGKYQRLLVKNEGEREEMPPDTPDGIGMNVRFSSGNFQEIVNPGEGLVMLPISLNRIKYPVTFRWHINPRNGISYWIRNGNTRSKLDTIGSILIASRTDGLLRLEGRATSLGKELTARIPISFNLATAFPNPFNPSTRLDYDLPNDSNVKLILYDILGREVTTLVNDFVEAGYHSATWNASDQASGVYFARFNVSDASGNPTFTKVNKLLLMK